MAYFPVFIQLKDKKILIVGGGNIAQEKLLHLLDFTKSIKLIACEFSDEIMALININNLEFEKRPYIDMDIKEFNIVIVAVDDLIVQEKIFNEAKVLPNCLVNSVDSIDYCDFIFPSYVKKDDLIVAVSTSGASPALAKYIRKFLEKIIPNNINIFLEKMKKYRKTMSKGKERMKFLDEHAKNYIQTWKIKE